MKVLTIQEPCASAFLYGKHYETRSWTTNYRGPILLHAGKKPWLHAGAWEQADQLGIVTHPGYLIAKGELVDVIKMDSDFIRKILNDRVEYNLGIYEVGRYAWVIENVEPINNTIVRGYPWLWELKEEN